MPSMMVWPVSSSVWTLNVGSSSASRWIAVPSFSWSPLVFGSIATLMTGAGKVIDSSTIGLSASHRVSPVVVCLRPMTAQMSPALDLADVLTRVGVHLHEPADLLLAVLGAVEHLGAAWSVPE